MSMQPPSLSPSQVLDKFKLEEGNGDSVTIQYINKEEKKEDESEENNSKTPTETASLVSEVNYRLFDSF